MNVQKISKGGYRLVELSKDGKSFLVPSKNKNAVSLFIAGGPEFDKKVAAANRAIDENRFAEIVKASGVFIASGPAVDEKIRAANAELEKQQVASAPKSNESVFSRVISFIKSIF